MQTLEFQLLAAVNFIITQQIIEASKLAEEWVAPSNLFLEGFRSLGSHLGWVQLLCPFSTSTLLQYTLCAAFAFIGILAKFEVIEHRIGLSALFTIFAAG